MQRSAWMRGSCLLGRHPCRTQAAGERYPTHLDGAETYAESSCHEEWLHSATFLITRLLLTGIFSRVSASLRVQRNLSRICVDKGRARCRKDTGPTSLRKLRTLHSCNLNAASALREGTLRRPTIRERSLR
jgi:hypothetical protein